MIKKSLFVPKLCVIKYSLKIIYKIRHILFYKFLNEFSSLTLIAHNFGTNKDFLILKVSN